MNMTAVVLSMLSTGCHCECICFNIQPDNFFCFVGVGVNYMCKCQSKLLPVVTVPSTAGICEVQWVTLEQQIVKVSCS
jgi:hypothetical protein